MTESVGHVAYRKHPIDLARAAAGLTDLWSPKVAVRINDVLVKVVKIEGDFLWHHHPDTDEAFLVLSGELVIDIREGDPAIERPLSLSAGDMFVIPRAAFHRPRSTSGATVALFEGPGVVNTGSSGGELTAPVDSWLD